MNYRLIILDYFYQYLNHQGVKQATFCFLDRKYPNNLAKCLFDNQLIRAYHFKAPRVFMKEYDLNKIEGTILEMVMDVKEQLMLPYTEFSYEMNDPYYFKDLRLLDFKYLHAIPLYKDEILDLVVFAYSDASTIEIKEASLIQLQNKLIMAENEFLINKLNELKLANTSDFAIVNSENKSLYLSKNVQSILKLANNYYCGLNDKKTFTNIVKKLEQFEKNNFIVCKEELFGSKISFYRLMLKTITRPIYAFEQLKLDPYQEHYTIFFLTNQNYHHYYLIDYLDDIKKCLSEVFIEEYDIYEYCDNTCCLIVPSLLDQRTIKKVEDYFNKKVSFKCIGLNTAYDVGINVDFKALFAYLADKLEFNRQGFLDYLRLKQEAILESEYEVGFIPKAQHLFSTITKEVIGYYYGYQHLDLGEKQKNFFYLHASEKILNEIIQIDFVNQKRPIIFRCNYTMFTSKKIWYALRKLTNCPHKAIILSEVNLSSQEAFNRFVHIIHRLHNENFQVYFDSSIFTNIMLTDITHLYEGIYVEDYEMSLGEEEVENLFTTVITFYLKENKNIILNNKKSQELKYLHKNIFYLNESYVNEN